MVMSEAVCPICRTGIPIQSKSAFVFNQIRCTGCGTLLEILDRATLTLGEVDEHWEYAADPVRYDRVNRPARGSRANVDYRREGA